MTATNHALTGAAIGLIIGRPLIAIPIAIVSHFVLDGLPHFDRKPGISANMWIKSKTFQKILLLDMLGCIILVMILAGTHPYNWLLASICAFLATSPDLLWLNHFIKARHNKPWNPSPFAKFASKVQWFAKPIGVVVELAWFTSGVIVIGTFVR